MTEQEGTREEKTRGDGTRGDKRREEISCDTIPHTDKRSFRIHGSRGHFTRRQLTPRALNARVHSSPYKKKKAVRFPGGLGTAATPAHPWDQARATQKPPRPAQEHPRATQDHPGRPKSRPRDAKRAPRGAKSAERSGAAQDSFHREHREAVETSTGMPQRGVRQSFKAETQIVQLPAPAQGRPRAWLGPGALWPGDRAPPLLLILWYFHGLEVINR